MFFDRKKVAETLGKKPEDVILGFTCSTWDLFHAGHIVMLAEAKSLCDYLIVGILTDPTIDRPETKNKPVQSVFERYIQVSSCRHVDEVIPFESEKDLLDMILTINPSVRIVGEEYEHKEHTGKSLGNISYNRRRHSFSSTELRERVALAEQSK